MEKKLPLVSIIVPLYNAEKFISDCIDAVLAQKMSDFELILIDDGSTDGTGDICRKYKEKDCRIKYYSYENAGVSVARNRGIACAEGAYIVFADADDIMCDNLLTVLVADIEENQCEIAVAGYYEWRSEKCVIPRYGTGSKIFLQGAEIMNAFLTGNSIHSAVWAKIFKADIVKKSAFPTGIAIAEDMYFIYQTLQNTSRLLIHDVCLYKYKITENSAMTSSISIKNFDAFKVYKRIYRESVENYPLLKKDAECFFLKNYLWQLRYIYSLNARVDAFSENIKSVKREIARFKISQAINVLPKKQWIEYMVIKVMPRMYQPYIMCFKFYQDVQRKKQKM